MSYTIDELSYELTDMGDGRIRVVVSISPNDEGVELGVLYFERAKRMFQRKPIGMDGWCLIDAKITGLYDYGHDNITPKDIVAKCQSLIKEFNSSFQISG
jgi:hypothetical protein